MTTRFPADALLALLVLTTPAAWAGGVQQHKSGTIQINAGGQYIWTANADSRSVSRIDAASRRATEYPLSACTPQGIAVRDDGAEVWVTCPNEDVVLVLDGQAATELARIEFPYGSAPAFVALSPGQDVALATLHRGDAIAVLDTARRQVTSTLRCARAPLGIAWIRPGMTAWITHAFSDGKRALVTRVDVGGSMPRIAATSPIGLQEPQVSRRLTGTDIFKAEGGAVTLRGHLAQAPVEFGTNEVWLPAQHSAIHDPIVTADSTIQAAIHRLDPVAGRVDPSRRIVLSAVEAHDPLDPEGDRHPGWDAHVAGFVDIAFTTSPPRAWLVGENSEDVLVVPSDTAPWRSSATEPRLVELALDRTLTGIVASPTRGEIYVHEALDGSVAILDAADGRTVSGVRVTPFTVAGLSSQLRLGRRVFNTSALLSTSRTAKVACASCHWSGQHDGLVWDFQNLSPALGPRATTSMLGLSLTFGAIDPVTRLGQLHRAGDRDEIEDFEHTFRGQQMGGTGFFVAPPHPYGGAPNTGRAPEIDAMAAFLLSLPAPARSPHRTSWGGLTPSATRGALIFRGDPLQPAGGGCIACHVPSKGFADGCFHDVGSARPATERQINARAPAWQVNTPTLVGMWATAPHDDAGSPGDQRQEMVDVLAGFAGRPAGAIAHGHIAGLTRAQIKDLAAYVLSIDAGSTAEELATATDATPPRLIRVEVASLTRIDCWFDESVDAATAGSPSSWRVVAEGGAEIPVIAAAWDATWGDRVTLTTQPLPRDCAGRTFTVMAAGIADANESATGGSPNVLAAGASGSTQPFVLGDAITLTLGNSGRENIQVSVHDAGMSGPDQPDATDDEPWLRRIVGPYGTVGFVRFEWEAPFIQAVGSIDPSRIVDASLSLSPQWGSAQAIGLRRVLQSWSDGHAGDGATSALGAPTWNQHAAGIGAWNGAGASVLGGRGDTSMDYFGAYDLAATVDATASVDDLSQRVAFRGSALTQALRFWLANPSLDMGHALAIADGTASELRFHGSERAQGIEAPVLSITYTLPPAPHPASEVSADASDRPMLVEASGRDVVLAFEHDGFGLDHEVFEGQVGSWYSHVGAGCAATQLAGSGRVAIVHSPGAGSRYFLVGVSSPCGGSLGASTTGLTRSVRFSSCAP